MFKKNKQAMYAKPTKYLNEYNTFKAIMPEAMMYYKNTE